MDCGKLVVGVIERELNDWTSAITDEASAGPADMICDRGAFAFKHLPKLAHLRVGTFGTWTFVCLCMLVVLISRSGGGC